MKAKMTSFCKEFESKVALFNTLKEALEHSQCTDATVVYWGQDSFGRKSWLMKHLDLERIIAMAAILILTRSKEVIEENGFDGLPLNEAIKAVESKYSMYPTKMPDIRIANRTNKLCFANKRVNKEVRDWAFMFELLDMPDHALSHPAHDIVRHFLKRSEGHKSFQTTVTDVLNMIEAEVDRHIPDLPDA